MTNQCFIVQQRWFAEVWNQGRTEVIDELLSPDVTAHGLVDPNGNPVHGAEQFKLYHQSFRSAFPDIRVTVEDTVCEGNKIVVRCRVQATHTGAGFGFTPTHKPVDFAGMCMLRIDEGKIVEAWNSFDFLAMFGQLGMLSMPG